MILKCLLCPMSMCCSILPIQCRCDQVILCLFVILFFSQSASYSSVRGHTAPLGERLYFLLQSFRTDPIPIHVAVDVVI